MQIGGFQAMSRGWEVGIGNKLSVCRDSFWGNEDALGLERSGGCTALLMY